VRSIKLSKENFFAHKSITAIFNIGSKSMEVALVGSRIESQVILD